MSRRVAGPKNMVALHIHIDNAQPRGTQRYSGIVRADEDALTQAVVALASQYEATVSEVHIARSGSATFIDMVGQHPFNAFTGVIFASDTGTVGDVSDLAGKVVDIRGAVRLYHGKPEIVIESRNQIKVR